MENSNDGYYVGTSLKHPQTYDVRIKAARSVQNTDTVYFQHTNITKPKITKIDIVADAATKHIEAIKGNYAAAHNKTEIEALNRLSQVFVDATKKLSRLKRKTQLVEQAPRTEENATAPRVEQTTQAMLTGPTEPPPRVHKATNNVPNLIPTDDSNDESSNDESNNDNEYVDTYEQNPAYNTHVAYARICCNVRPEKINEPNRCRITTSRDRINYPHEVATPMADLLTVKLLLNIVI
ncbi:hypothetical protein ACHAW6_005132 [Cyclotella cf. meneghiniana]